MVGHEALGQGEHMTHPQSSVPVGPPRTPGPWAGGRVSERQCPSLARLRGLATGEGWALPGDPGHSCPQLPRQPRATWVSSAGLGPGGGTVTAERQPLNNSATLGILIPRGRPTASPSAFHLGSPELLHTPEVSSASSPGRNLLLQPCFLHSCDPARAISVISLSSVLGAQTGKEESVCNVGSPGLIPGMGRSPGEGNGNLLQYYCLENSLDRGAWQAAVHGVEKNRTRLSDFQSLTHSPLSHVTKSLQFHCRNHVL